jgi:hypothetical protein
MNNENETSVGASPDQQAQQGALGVASGSASSRPGDRGVWSIGDPLNPTPDDAMCGSESAARHNAREMSSPERIMAVWHGAACVALYWEGKPWRPA